MYYVQLHQQSNQCIILVIVNCSKCVNNLSTEILIIAFIIIPKRTTTELWDYEPIQLQVNSTATEILPQNCLSEPEPQKPRLLEQLIQQSNCINRITTLET